MARTLKQIREQNALRQINLTLRNKIDGGKKVHVWVWNDEQEKTIRTLGDEFKTGRKGIKT